MIKRFLILVLGLWLLLGGAGALSAITAVDRDFDQLVTRADTVFKGTVTAKSSRWIGERETRHIATFVTFRVEETYKGTPAAEQTLRFLGGTVGEETMEVPDMPRFEVGQGAVLFVVGNGRQFCPLVGIAQGRFHVRRDDASGREQVFTDAGAPVADTREIGRADATGVPRLHRDAHPGAPAMTSEDFKAEILAKVAALPR